jgi:hypothetical protein
LLVAVCVWSLWPQPELPPTSISRETFHRIKLGMTRAEVTEILGPAGNRRTLEVEVDFSVHREDIYSNEDARKANRTYASWVTDTATVSLEFDDTGAVAVAHFDPTRPSTDSAWIKFCRRFDSLRRRWFP